VGRPFRNRSTQQCAIGTTSGGVGATGSSSMPVSGRIRALGPGSSIGAVCRAGTVSSPRGCEHPPLEQGRAPRRARQLGTAQLESTSVRRHPRVRVEMPARQRPRSSRCTTCPMCRTPQRPCRARAARGSAMCDHPPTKRPVFPTGRRRRLGPVSAGHHGPLRPSARPDPWVRRPSPHASAGSHHGAVHRPGPYGTRSATTARPHAESDLTRTLLRQRHSRLRRARASDRHSRPSGGRTTFNCQDRPVPFVEPPTSKMAPVQAATVTCMLFSSALPAGVWGGHGKVCSTTRYIQRLRTSRTVSQNAAGSAPQKPGRKLRIANDCRHLV